MACGSTMIWCSADRLQQTTTRLLQALTLLLNHNPLTQWLGWWRLFYSVCSSLSFISIHHSPQAHLQSSHCIVTVYTLTHNVLPASPGHAQKRVNNQQQPPSMLTAGLANLVSAFLLTYQQLHNHSPDSRNLLSCMANQILWSTHKPITKDHIASKLNHFLHQSLT